MGSINDDGQLSDEQEEQLGKAIGEMVDDFGPDFDEEGNELEEGESDRIKSEEEREKSGGTSQEESEEQEEEEEEEEREKEPASA